MNLQTDRRTEKVFLTKVLFKYACCTGAKVIRVQSTSFITHLLQLILLKFNITFIFKILNV